MGYHVGAENYVRERNGTDSRKGGVIVPKEEMWENVFCQAQWSDIRAKIDNVVHAVTYADPEKLAGILPDIYPARIAAPVTGAD